MGEPARVIPMPRKPSFADALKSTKVEKKSASKKKEKVIDVPEIKPDVDRYCTLKKQFKMIEADMEDVAGRIRDLVQQYQDEDGYNDNFATAYTVKGENDSTKFVSSNRFSINASDSDKIAEIVGDHFDDLLLEKHTVKLRDQVFEDERMSARLMELIGDEFAEFFETVTAISVKEDFNRKIYRIVPADRMPELRLFCRPYKASLR